MVIAATLMKHDELMNSVARTSLRRRNLALKVIITILLRLLTTHRTTPLALTSSRLCKLAMLPPAVPKTKHKPGQGTRRSGQLRINPPLPGQLPPRNLSEPQERWTSTKITMIVLKRTKRLVLLPMDLVPRQGPVMQSQHRQRLEESMVHQAPPLKRSKV